jgi:TonB family protein
MLLLACALGAQTKGEKEQAADKDKPITATEEELNFCKLLDANRKDEIKEAGRRLTRVRTDAGDLPADNVVPGKWERPMRATYPSEARARRISGYVVLRVLVDETGQIVRANAICGPRQLRKATEEAALRARYAPATLNGQPVKLSSVVYYRFVID